MKNLFFSIPFAAVLLFIVNAPARAGSEDIDQKTSTINYFLNTLDMEKILKEAFMKEAGSDPLLNDLFAGSLRGFSTQGLARRLASGLGDRVSPEEMAPCSSFIDSPAGSALARAQAAQPVRDANSFVASYRALPKQEKAAASTFFMSSCGRKISDYMNSDKAREIGRSYGEELICMHVQKTNKDMLLHFRANGKCL